MGQAAAGCASACEVPVLVRTPASFAVSGNACGRTWSCRRWRVCKQPGILTWRATHDLLALSLEVRDGPVQDLHAHVDLDLQLRERQFPVAGGKIDYRLVGPLGGMLIMGCCGNSTRQRAATASCAATPTVIAGRGYALRMITVVKMLLSHLEAGDHGSSRTG